MKRCQTKIVESKRVTGPQPPPLSAGMPVWQRDPGQTEAVRVPQVHVQLSELQEVVGLLECNIEGLTDRLGVVLRPAEPKNTALQRPEEIIASLAQSIRSIRERVSMIQETIDDLLDRLEV